MLWEQRWHPLRREWVIIAAHRQDRPWSGHTSAQHEEDLPAHVPDCYLCPGNERISGQRNPDYEQTFVFDNDHPCVGLDAPAELAPPVGIYRSRPATGIARVVCYSPCHNLTLTELPVAQIQHLLGLWQQQYVDLGGRDGINHVLIFENKGQAVGVSNPHPHCQIYATNFVFKTIEIELEAARDHHNQTGRVLYQDVIAAEQEDGRRVLIENDTAIAFVPYFARYAYEVHVSPKAAHQSLATLSDAELADLAAALKCVLIKYDNLWRMPMPYVMIPHQVPTDGADYPGFHFHIEIYPPLRKPGLLKHLAGPEIGGGSFISDTSPEQKAAELNALPDQHYKQT